MYLKKNIGNQVSRGGGQDLGKGGEINTFHPLEPLNMGGRAKVHSKPPDAIIAQSINLLS